MENNIEIAKAEFVKAYEWALKVQRACMFTKFGVEINLSYCKPNDREGCIDAWTVDIYINDHEANERITACYYPWYGDKKFLPEMGYVQGYLAARGIKIDVE